MVGLVVSILFTSFDYDHDEDLRTLLVNQAKFDDSPFDMADWSVKEPMTGDWQAKVRTRIKSVHQVLVMCGEHTDTATGVSVELAIAQEEDIPYFLLFGRKDGPARSRVPPKPTTRSTSGPGTI